MRLKYKYQMGGPSNYYGQLSLREGNGAYFWGIEDCDADFGWEEISKDTYDAIKREFKKAERKSNWDDGSMSK